MIVRKVFIWEGEQASRHNPFLVQRIRRLLFDWQHDGEPTPATLVNGQQVTILRLTWSDEPWPVRLFVATNGLAYRLPDFARLGEIVFGKAGQKADNGLFVDTKALA